MKKIVALLTLLIMLITSLPIGVLAQEISNISFGERASAEQIYYSDIFYTYPYYLKSNPYLDRYQATTSGLIYNVLSEYVTTDHFSLSVTSQVLGQATDVSSVIKYFKNNMNYQDFVFENELDTANRLLLQAISENDIKKAASIYSKNASEQVKNFSSLTKLATTLEDTYKTIEGAEELDTYKTMLNETFSFLETVSPRLKSKFPEINDSLAKKLGDDLESVSKVADAMEFAAALAVTVLAQEAQLELVYDILNDAPTDSMLYKGMTRLKGQLEGGAVTFFTETFLNDAVFKKVIDKFTDGIIKSIGGKVPGLNVIPLILAVVDVVNTVVFKWVLGADYDTYIAAVLLTDYKEGLAATLDNMSDRYAVYFSSDDIIAYDNVFNTYISVNKEVYNLYCKLSTHNATYNSTYTASYSSLYEDMSYEKYIGEVKAYIISIPDEVREIADRGTWNINSDAELSYSTDIIEYGKYYIPRDFRGGITISKGELIIPDGNSFTVNGNLNITGDKAKLTNYGSIEVSGKLTMGTANTYLYNYGTLALNEVVLTGYQRNSWDYHNPYFYNYGEVTVYGDFSMLDTSRQMLFMNEGEPVLRIHGNIKGNANNYDVTKGMILLCGNTQQTVESMSVNNLTVTNSEGIKYNGHVYVKGRYDLCGNPLDNNGYITYLEGSGSLAPSNDYKKVHVNCGLTLEGYIKGEYTVQQNMSITVPEGIKAVIDGDLLVTGAYSKVTNNGELTVTGLVNMASMDPKLYNYGRFTAGSMILTGYYRNSSDYYNPFFYNYGEATVCGDLSMTDTSRQMLFMNDGEPVLRIHGNIKGNANNYDVTKGMILLCGSTQQTVEGMSVNNLTVTNSEGIKYNGHVYVKGRYDLCGNALDNNGYTTYLEGSASLAPANDYKKVHVNCGLTLEGYIKGEYTVQQNMSITVPEGIKAVIDGDLLVTGAYSKVTNNGELTVTGLVNMASRNPKLYNYGRFTAGSMILTGYYRNSSDYYNPFFYNYGEATVCGDLSMTDTSRQMLFMNEGEPVLRIHGNIRGISNNYDVTKGMILLCGSTQQTVDSMSVNNLTVTNSEGIKYNGHVYVKGRYDLCGNPLDNNGYITYLEGSGSLAPSNDYKKVHVNCGLTLEGYIKGEYTIQQNMSITVPEGINAVIDGDLLVTGAYSKVINNGELTVTGLVNMASRDPKLYNYGRFTADSMILTGYYRNSSDYYNPFFYNYGEATVCGDLSMTGTSRQMLFNSSDEAVLYVGGDFVGNGASGLTVGKVILCGDGSQCIKNTGKLNVLVIENESYEGVNFESNIDYTTLFDHKGNRFRGNLSNVDYDGDGMYDRYDPKPTVNEKCSVISRDYDVMIGHASDINQIRYASGIHEDSDSIRNAEDRVDINASVIAENTVNNVYTRNMPDGGVYTFWIRLNDGTTFLRVVDMSRMNQRVSVNGVHITTHNLYGVKDYFIAEGDYDSYNEIKAEGYIVRLTESKLGTKHDYTYTVSNPGRHTVLVRYDDTTRPDEVFKVDLVVDEPTFSVNGLQVTIGNIPGVKVIRTAYGEYNTPGDTKRADGARNFSNKAVIKDADSYTIQYREEGMITIVVEYDNGYVKVFHYDLVQKKPTVVQDESTVTFSELDGLVMIRYAKGEYATSSEIKKATGSKTIKPDTIVDGKITVTLESGTYTFCVQYDDDSYNYYTITVETII